MPLGRAGTVTKHRAWHDPRLQRTATALRCVRGTAFPEPDFLPAAPCLARHPRLEHRPTEGGKPPIMAPGEVAEWSIAPHSKCGIGASLSGVRIPPSPPEKPETQKFKLYRIRLPKTTGGTQEWPQMGFRMHQPWAHPRSRVWWVSSAGPGAAGRFARVAREIKVPLHTKDRDEALI